MAQRRMFSKAITNSSQFLMMPHSTQNLYFHLGMNADDDGFCEHFSIMRMTDSKPDDLKILQAKHFVNVFDDKVLVITDWSENNYIRNDRYTPSRYLEIYSEEIKRLSSGIPNGNQMATQVRLGEVSLGNNICALKSCKTTEEYTADFNTFWNKYPRHVSKQSAYKAWIKNKPNSAFLADVLKALEWQVCQDSWKKDNGQFIPHPATYLNQKRWLDEKPSNIKAAFKFPGRSIG